MPQSPVNNPPNYQEQVKAKEFLEFLKKHGIITEEGGSRQASNEDSAYVKDHLHIGVKLLISNSKGPNRQETRKELERMLLLQAASFLGSSFDDVEALGTKITNLIKEEERRMAKSTPSAENMEIDFYVQGWAEEPLSPVKSYHEDIMGITSDVIPLHMGTPESRSALSLERPQKMTSSAKGNSNVVNVGEAACTSDDCLPKKVAQLERALTYARYRASKDDIEKVVGYGALCMSMVDGSSLASAMISLNVDMFPLLACMQKKGDLAHLFSSRTIFSDVEKAMEAFHSMKQDFRELERQWDRQMQLMQFMQCCGILALAWLVWHK